VATLPRCFVDDLDDATLRDFAQRLRETP
jgi:hypothetical protein